VLLVDSIGERLADQLTRPIPGGGTRDRLILTIKLQHLPSVLLFRRVRSALRIVGRLPAATA
jgi:hypothetical protein